MAENGYEAILVGKQLKNSHPLKEEKFRQKRLRIWFKKGKLFYFEYNLRLFFFLLFKKMDAICAIDLDTIIPGFLVSKLKRVPRIYDAHEYFTELKEIVTRPAIKKVWMAVEKFSIPRFKYGYTVGEKIATEFKRLYGVDYALVRNIAKLKPLTMPPANEKFLLYQGAVNEARAFEEVIPAMKLIDMKLVVCGDGNFMPQLKKLIEENDVGHKVELRGMVPPAELWNITQQAWLGIAVAESTGLNQYWALPNKFFDFIHAGVPQLTMDYPEYRKINEKYEVAILLEKPDPMAIAAAINNLLQNDVLYGSLKKNCLEARQVLNWQNEEKTLLDFYQLVFND
jgi:glycosyltransferase involved in cell wall biosynthesis